MVRNLTEQEINDIPALKASGWTTHGIARKFGVHDTAIRYWYRRLEQAGHSIPKDKMGRPPIQIKINNHNEDK